MLGKNFLNERGNQDLEQAAQGNGRITMPGSVQKAYGWGTYTHGLSSELGSARLMLGLDILRFLF